MKIGDPVRLNITRSHKLPKGSIGVIVDRTNPTGCFVEWRRGGREWVSYVYLKPARFETISKQQRLWLVKRRLREAVRVDIT